MRCALLFTLSLIFVGISTGHATPTEATIIQQARARLGAETNLQVTSIVKEGTLFDPEGNKVAYVQFKAQHPNKRWEYSLGNNGTIETINGTDGLEGFSKRINVPSRQSQVHVLSGRERALLFDLTEADLGFFSAPRRGKVALEGESTQQNRVCHALLYTYAGGQKIRYHFDKKTHDLVAQEILSPIEGKSTILLIPSGEISSAGIRFPKQFAIYENGKQTGLVEYTSIVVNVNIPANDFAFPLL